jgi:hypothetical protein
MKASMDNCVSGLYKTVEIIEPAGRGDVNGKIAGESLQEELEVTPYPNPASENLQISIHATLKDPIELRLISTVDNRLITHEIVEGYHDYLVRWDLPEGVAGVYYLFYKQNKTIRSKRIVIIR